MTEELFDVVDQNDNPTGQKLNKEAVHKDGTLHRCAAVFVFDGKGEMYLQNHWTGAIDHTVGGHVSAGEDYLPAATREMGEEIGLKNVELKTIATSLYSDEEFNPEIQKVRVKHMFGVFECQAPHNWKFEPNEEVSSIFLQSVQKTVEEMNKTPTKYTPGFINTMAEYLKVKDLPYKLDVAKARQNWGKP